MKSIRTAARQLDLPRATAHKVLHKNLKLFAYKVKMLQTLQPNDMPRQKEFAVNMLKRISEDEAFLKRVCYSDEAGNLSCLRKVKQTQCKNLGIRKSPCDQRTLAR